MDLIVGPKTKSRSVLAICTIILFMGIGVLFYLIFKDDLKRRKAEGTGSFQNGKVDQSFDEDARSRDDSKYDIGMMD